MRHLLPMKELERAILSLSPPAALPPEEPPLSPLPPPHAASATASTTATPAAPIQRLVPRMGTSPHGTDPDRGDPRLDTTRRCSISPSSARKLSAQPCERQHAP